MPLVKTDGIVTFYEERGEGPALVLIHGHSADLRMWDYQLPALSDAGFRVIRYDVRGHGRTTAPATGYTWENYAQDLHDLLDVLGAGPAHLAGSSMGGGVALQFALDHPGRVHSLTLVDSALPGFTYSKEFSRSIEELQEAVRVEGPRAAFERLWLIHPLFDGVRRYPGRFAALREIVLGFQALEYREGAGPPDYRPDITGRLAEIAQPALVIAGERDIPDFLLIAEILGTALPNGRLLIMRDCGHLPSVEDPQAFNAAMIVFLRAAS